MPNIKAVTIPSHVIVTTPDGPVLHDLQPGQVLSTASTVETYRDREAAVTALVAADPNAIIPDWTPPTRAEARAARLEQLTLATAVASRLSAEARIKTSTVPNKDIETLSVLYDPWHPGRKYETGDLHSWDGTIIECIQSHTNTDPTHTPDTTPALWRVHRTTSGPTPDQWVQPTGSTDTYAVDDLVTYKGSIYKSLIPANTTVPGSDPRWWELTP